MVDKCMPPCAGARRGKRWQTHDVRCGWVCLYLCQDIRNNMYECYVKHECLGVPWRRLEVV